MAIIMRESTKKYLDEGGHLHLSLPRRCGATTFLVQMLAARKDSCLVTSDYRGIVRQLKDSSSAWRVFRPTHMRGRRYKLVLAENISKEDEPYWEEIVRHVCVSSLRLDTQ